MKRRVYFIVLMMGMFFPLSAQSICDRVKIVSRTTVTYAKAYIGSVRKKCLQQQKKVLLPVTDTFKITDICVSDSVVIYELEDLNRAFDYVESVFKGRVIDISPDVICVLSKENPLTRKGKKLKVGDIYCFTLIPYFPVYRWPNLGFDPPILIGDTAYLVQFFPSNLYTSPDINGMYYVPESD